MSNDQLWIRDLDYCHIQHQLDNAYQSWRSGKFGSGPWYIYFEHHAEMNLGIKCQINYDNRTASNINVIDEEKFMMFMLKYS
jgi:hypothetical protein